MPRICADVHAQFPHELLNGQGRFPAVALARFVHEPSLVGLLPAIGFEIAQAEERNRRPVINLAGVKGT